MPKQTLISARWLLLSGLGEFGHRHFGVGAGLPYHGKTSAASQQGSDGSLTVMRWEKARAPLQSRETLSRERPRAHDPWAGYMKFILYHLNNIFAIYTQTRVYQSSSIYLTPYGGWSLQHQDLAQWWIFWGALWLFGRSIKLLPVTFLLTTSVRLESRAMSNTSMQLWMRLMLTAMWWTATGTGMRQTWL